MNVTTRTYWLANNTRYTWYTWHT